MIVSRKPVDDRDDALGALRSTFVFDEVERAQRERPHDLDDEVIARAEPAVERHPVDAQLLGEHAHVDPFGRQKPASPETQRIRSPRPCNNAHEQKDYRREEGARADWRGLASKAAERRARLPPPRLAPVLGDAYGRPHELGQVLAQMIQVLEQPDAVVRARRGVEAVRRGEARRLQDSDGRSCGLPDELGQALVPRGERVRALAERVPRGSDAGRVARAGRRSRGRSGAAAASRRPGATAPAFRCAWCPARRGSRAARRRGATPAATAGRAPSGSTARSPDAQSTACVR